MKVPVLFPQIFDYPFTYDSANLKLNIDRSIYWRLMIENINKYLSSRHTKRLNFTQPFPLELHHANYIIFPHRIGHLGHSKRKF